MRQLQRGIGNFVEYRRDVLLPRVPPHRSRLPQFPYPAPKPQAAFLRPIALTSAVSIALLAAIVVIHFVSPRSLTAAEFFRNVTLASDSPIPRRHVAAQRVRLRRGARTLERKIIQGNARAASAPDLEWSALLANLPVDEQDPLSPSAFQRWHAAQRESEDNITEDGGLITLTTTTPYLRASLVARRADWRTITLRFDLPGQPAIEIQELAFELRAEAPAVTARVLPPRAFRTPPAPFKPIESMMDDPELAEIRLREILHQTGADRAELPTITRDGTRLRVEAIAGTAERREELLAALEALPSVDARIAGEAKISTEVAKQIRPAPPAFETTPPLAKALWEHLGGLEPANNYLDMVRSSWIRALSASSALERLARRYPTVAVGQLAPGIQLRVAKLSAQSNREISKDLQAYLDLLAEPLQAMLRGEGLSDPAAAAPQGSCLYWQDAAPRQVEDLRMLQTSIRRLFQIDYSEIPIKISAGMLLKDASLAHARLQHGIGCLTQPEQDQQ